MRPEDIATVLVLEPETLHFILRLTDKGTPAHSRYQRAVMTVTP
jgi:hypothetical protein